MARPSRINEKRRRLLPVVAAAFAELGYRRATTAELALRCGIRENVLYRLWSDKKAMFIASIDYVYDQAHEAWQRVLDDAGDTADATGVLLEHEIRHHGESGLHRIIFAGLSETDDAKIRAALRKMYGRFHAFISARIRARRDARRASDEQPEADLIAWALVGLGDVANIGGELGLLSRKRRKEMLGAVGRLLLAESDT
jgi:AcrR family transcriptional regulator